MAVKSVLVTGGTTRLGRVIAERLKTEGWRVLTSSHRADSGADVIVDLSESAGAARLYTETMRILGGLPPDALVNNAAVFIGEDSLLDAVNLSAPKKLIRLMAGRETKGRGAVVNVLDTRILSKAPETAYERTKSGLLAFTRDSALTYADTLRVNAVAPGPVLAPTQIHEAAGELLVARPTTEDVAAAVVYLLSAESTTGCVIPVDGGQHLLVEDE